jgi:hypothetical protein
LTQREPGQPYFWAVDRKPGCGSGIVHWWIPEDELLKMEKSGQFPDESVTRSVRIKV